MTSTSLYNQVKDTLDRIDWPKYLTFKAGNFCLLMLDDRIDFGIDNLPISAREAQAIIEHHLMDWLDENIGTEGCGYWAMNRLHGGLAQRYEVVIDGEDGPDDFPIWKRCDDRLSALLWLVNKVLEDKDG